MITMAGDFIKNNKDEPHEVVTKSHHVTSFQVQKQFGN